ncbi:hypothetical protein PG999_001238 [Apiospora kogelbergensis]|uniref:Uncharacterized protein n=1 Tax=Apiospora kogelbergensis TaxID=1337665 RepID=A0AAW0RDR6_9PEZI
MHFPRSAAAVALLAASAAALPNNLRRETEPPAPTAAPTETDANLQPWVTVGDDSKPSTVTPVRTTISGTPTVVSAPPNGLTATVFTSYSEAAGHTSTGTAPAAPTAGSADGGQGSFLKCTKPKGEPFAPFCAPLPWDAQEYRPGNTYYFTWDATWFKSAPNTTIQITGSYVNETTGETTTEAFHSEGPIIASWGYWSWHADRKLLNGQHALNLTVAMASLKPGGDAKGAALYQGPKILLSDPPVPKPKPVPTPAGPALYIGLPVILGFALLCIFGVCIWNARHRRIELGNIMSRGRHGYGINKSGRSRVGGLGGASKSKKAAERVQLMERELAADGAAAYRDHDNEAQSGYPRWSAPAAPAATATPWAAWPAPRPRTARCTSSGPPPLVATTRAAPTPSATSSSDRMASVSKVFASSGCAWAPTMAAAA